MRDGLSEFLEIGLLFTLEQARRAGVSEPELRVALRERALRKHLVPRARFLTLCRPVFASRSGTPLRAGRLEGALRARFDGVPARALVAYSAREAIDPAKLEHELHLTEVYLFYRAHRPDLAWLPESAIRAQYALGGEDLVVPDAGLVDPKSGELFTFVDYVSAYRSPRLTALHGFAASRGLAIEFW